jgi:hypothetical protein
MTMQPRLEDGFCLLASNGCSGIDRGEQFA